MFYCVCNKHQEDASLSLECQVFFAFSFFFRSPFNVAAARARFIFSIRIYQHF